MADESQKPKKTEEEGKGWLFWLLTSAVFVGLSFFSKGTECRIELMPTTGCVGHLASAGELTIMFAGLYAVVRPKDVLAGVKDLIVAIREFLLRMSDAPKADADARPAVWGRALWNKGRWSRARGSHTAKGPYGVLHIAAGVVVVAAAVVTVLNIELRRATADAPPVDAEITTEPEPAAETATSTTTTTAAPVATAHTATANESCASIAARYCTEDRWREFADLNSIRYYQLPNEEWHCVLPIGKQQQLPQDWLNGSCTAVGGN